LIFNRWGGLVFRTNDITKGWDGRLNGVDQPVGTYVWIISYTDENNKRENAKGTVVLVR
jgi:gliding motility-associated-like protein